MRVIFLGSGEIAIPSFRALLGSGYRPLALVTQPDKPAGRHRELTPPPIKRVALEEGLQVLQPERVRDEEALEVLRRLEPDLMVVMAYGQILPKGLLRIPRVACVNLHASLLPRHRGASCIQAAIDGGDEETGITLMHVAPKLDAGDLIHAKRVRIGERETGGVLHDRLGELAAEVLMEALPGLMAGTAVRVVQDESLATYAPKLERDAGRLDWSWGGAAIDRRVRAYDPWPGTWTVDPEGAGSRRLKIFPGVGWVEEEGVVPGRVGLDGEGRVRVGTGDGWWYPGEVQADGGRRMKVEDWWRGLRGRERVWLEF